MTKLIPKTQTYQDVHTQILNLIYNNLSNRGIFVSSLKHLSQTTGISPKTIKETLCIYQSKTFVVLTSNNLIGIKVSQ